MPSTTNFGWTTPADTDLVKDGAAAIRTLGNGVDSSFVDLKGGTTGQILSKNSNTDLDFVWIANDQGDITAVTAGTGISGGGTSGAVTITNSMATEITASGDIIVGTGSGTFDNLPIGTTGQVLTADTTVSPYKVKWAAAASGSTFSGCYAFNSGNVSLSNSTSTTISFDSELFDVDGYHSTTTNTSRLTVPTGKSGKFLVTFTATVSNAANQVFLYIFKNGSETYRDQNFNGSFTQNYEISRIIDLAAGDYVEVKVWQNSGGTQTLGGYANGLDSMFAIVYLGA
jgi:hypothetical protein